MLTFVFNNETCTYTLCSGRVVVIVVGRSGGSGGGGSGGGISSSFQVALCASNDLGNRKVFASAQWSASLDAYNIAQIA